MKASQIEVGKAYTAKVSGKLTIVKVERIEEVYNSLLGKDQKRYHVLNLATGRRTKFRSAARFRFPRELANPRYTNQYPA